MKRNIKNIKGRKLGLKKGNNKKRMSLRKEKKKEIKDSSPGERRAAASNQTGQRKSCFFCNEKEIKKNKTVHEQDHKSHKRMSEKSEAAREAQASVCRGFDARV